MAKWIMTNVFIRYTHIQLSRNLHWSIWGKNQNEQEALGLIAHLRKQFKSMNTFAKKYDYIISWLREETPNHILFYNQTDLICKTLSWDFLNFVNIISLFRNYLLCKRVRSFIWINLNPVHPKILLYQVWLKLDQWFLRRRFLNFVNVFLLFRNYLPLEKDMALQL